MTRTKSSMPFFLWAHGDQADAIKKKKKKAEGEGKLAFYSVWHSRHEQVEASWPHFDLKTVYYNIWLRHYTRIHLRSDKWLGVGSFSVASQCSSCKPTGVGAASGLFLTWMEERVSLVLLETPVSVQISLPLLHFHVWNGSRGNGPL